jgi:hypothetical protein
MKKKAKKQKKKWMEALAIVSIALQAVEFGMELWGKLKEAQKTRVRTAKEAA